MMHPLQILFLGACLYCASASALALVPRHDEQLQHVIVDHRTLHARSTPPNDGNPGSGLAKYRPTGGGLVKHEPKGKKPPMIKTEKYTELLPVEADYLEKEADASMSKTERIRVIDCINAKLRKGYQTIEFGKNHERLGATAAGAAWFNKLVQDCGGPEGWMLPQLKLRLEEAELMREKADASMSEDERKKVVECINKQLGRVSRDVLEFPLNHHVLGLNQEGVDYFNVLVRRCGGPPGYELQVASTPPGRRIPYIDVGQRGHRRPEIIGECKPGARIKRGNRGMHPKKTDEPVDEPVDELVDNAIDVDAQSVGKLSPDTSSGSCSPTPPEKPPNPGTMFSSIKSYFVRPGRFGPGGVGGGVVSPLLRPFR